MEKETVELIPIEVEYECDKCKIGTMIYTGNITSKGFEHKCSNNKCDSIQSFDYKYPAITYKRKQKI
jgi:hypothetical protein